VFNGWAEAPGAATMAMPVETPPSERELRVDLQARDHAPELVADADPRQRDLPAGEINRLAAASRSLRRDRELAFYGAEDLTPSDFCRQPDADEARASARLVVGLVRPYVE